MCGAGLLGWKRGGSGAHHHSWQGHVHRHPVQGESMHTQHDSPAVVCNSCLFTAYFIWYVCPLVLTVGYYISPNFFLLLFFILVFFSPFFQQDVIQAIKETAFVTSEYPVILSFENHCRYV